jgi:uncharacterized protein (DUF697 family)
LFPTVRVGREIARIAGGMMSTQIPEADDAAPAQAVEVIAEEIRLRANNCIKNHVIAAMGVGLVPSFIVEVIGVTGIEVKMIRDLAKIYSFPVPGDLIAYKILISVIASVGPFYIAILMKSAVKTVPVLGHTAYVGFLSLTSGAAVYAVGKIFQKHYESGGTFLSMKNSVIRSFFKEKFEDGKKVAAAYVQEQRPAA